MKTYLGSMKYTAEEQGHAVRELSGGQKAKLFFLKMILDGCNVLVLDEPTRNFSPLSGPVIRAFRGLPGLYHQRQPRQEVHRPGVLHPVPAGAFGPGAHGKPVAGEAVRGGLDMERKPTLTLMVGLPRAGKTTRAKELERETGAIRFTPDEWHLFLFGDDFHDPREHALHDQRHDRVEQLMWGLGKRLLAQGVSVILDYGLLGQGAAGGKVPGGPGPGGGFPDLLRPRPPWKSCAAAWTPGRGRARRMCSRPSARGDMEQWAALFQPPDEAELAGRYDGGKGQRDGERREQRKERVP